MTTTTGVVGGVNQDISGGYFSLDVQKSGSTYTTAAIPYDAVALAANETGTIEKIAANNFITVKGQATVNGVGAVSQEGVVFIGDTLTFQGQGNVDEEYDVTDVQGAVVTLDKVYNGTSAISTAGYRHFGGRGSTTTSKIHCVTDSVYCTTARERISGSMQSKIEDLVSVIGDGVLVDREGPDVGGGYIWRVTFLDDAPTGANDYTIALGASTLTTAGTAIVTTTLLVDGESYGDCSGSLVVPKSGGLVKGSDYFARVFAVNNEGYSLPQSAGESMAPTVVPGAPTGVTLEVLSSTELRVLFSSPSDNGGASITEYKIEHDTDSSFGSPEVLSLTYLGGGAPFFKTISGLVKGTSYFVRVSAMNVNGYGPTQSTTPGSLNPHQTPGAPLGVGLKVTSDNMLTVGWSAPSDDGGDVVSEYRIEWDTSSGFNSGSIAPHKGYVDVNAASHSGHTIELLSSNTVYFARVAATNSAGVGTFAAATPASTSPSLQVPGTPHTVVAVGGGSSGEIDVTFQRPRVPHHGVVCGGTESSPDDCPTPYGGSVSASDGGSDIDEYEIEYNERMDFGGSDGSRVISTSLSKTLTGLTSGRVYYIRVLARNNVGAGAYCELSGTDICDGSLINVVATV